MLLFLCYLINNIFCSIIYAALLICEEPCRNIVFNCKMAYCEISVLRDRFPLKLSKKKKSPLNTCECKQVAL